MDCPLAASTPITVKGTFLMRMILPTGSSAPKRFCDDGWPSTAHVGGVLDVILGEKRAVATVQSRTAR